MNLAKNYWCCHIVGCIWLNISLLSHWWVNFGFNYCCGHIVGLSLHWKKLCCCCWGTFRLSRQWLIEIVFQQIYCSIGTFPPEFIFCGGPFLMILSSIKVNFIWSCYILSQFPLLLWGSLTVRVSFHSVHLHLGCPPLRSSFI